MHDDPQNFGGEGITVNELVELLSKQGSEQKKAGFEKIHSACRCACIPKIPGWSSQVVGKGLRKRSAATLVYFYMREKKAKDIFHNQFALVCHRKASQRSKISNALIHIPRKQMLLA